MRTSDENADLKRAALEYHEQPRPGKISVTPTLEVDGEMHADCALDSALRRAIMPHSTLQGDANLLVLPGIDAANIGYNLLKTAAGNNVAIGPILLGAARPVHILTASATVRRIVNMTALTVLDANSQR